jgi:hypothetical protein
VAPVGARFAELIINELVVLLAVCWDVSHSMLANLPMRVSQAAQLGVCCSCTAHLAPPPPPFSASVSLPVPCQVNAEVRFLLARLDFTDFYKEQ